MERPFLGGALISLAVAAAVLWLRAEEHFQRLEIGVYDQYVRLARQQPEREAPVLIVQVTEDDIDELGYWPLLDRDLADAVENLIAAEPLAVGIDIYRNFPVPPGSERLDTLLRGEKRIVAVYKARGTEDNGIPGPPALQETEQVGFNDFVIDRDGVIRRALLFQDDEAGNFQTSFGLRLALLALARHGIGPAPDPERPEWVRLGPTTLPPLESNDGGYRGMDAAGYQILLDFAGPRGGFETLDFSPIRRGDFDHDRVAGRIVLLGVVSESVKDFFPVPFASRRIAEGVPAIPGVELHAHIADQLVRHGLGESRYWHFLPEWAEIASVVLLAILGTAVATGFRGRSLLGTVATVLVLGFGLVGIWLGGAVAYRAGWWAPVVGPGIAWVSSAAIVTVWASSRERAQRAMLMQLFSRHVSQDLADDIWRHRESFFQDGRPRPRRLDATVLFVDMKGYTASAEKMDPEQLMNWVNEFMETMAGDIEEYGGFVDDFFGDGIKADFGVPFPRETEAEVADDARRAVDCALAMTEDLAALNAKYAERELPTVKMRVGINTGPVVAGSLGSSKLKYTVVGDVVVTAQRLESMRDVPHDFDRHPCRILVSDRTYGFLDASYQTEFLGNHSLKGKGEEVAVHRILGRSPEVE